MFDGTLTIDTALDVKGFDKGVINLVKSLKGLALTAGTVILGLLGIQSVKAVSTLAAEFQRLRQAAQAVGQIYGIAAPQTRKLIDELTASGIQSNIASRAFINFAKEGLDLGLLPALARGAQDLNALAESGQSSSDVFNGLLTGILKLDTQMLRDRGVVIDLNKAYKDYAATIGKGSDALSVQERRAAAMTAVIEKLNKVTGLYELSQKTAAGQLSSNKRIMAEFQNVIGGAFQDAFFNLIKGFNDLVKALTVAFKEGGRLRGLWLDMAAVATLLSRIIRSLFDAMAAWLGLKTEKTSAISSTGIDNVVESTNEATEAQEELGNAVEETGKKARGALSAFDQLDVLQQKEPGQPAGDAGVLESLGEVDLSQIEDPLKEIQKRADELLLKFKDVFQPLLEALLKLKKALEPLGIKIWEGLKWAWDNILMPLGKWVLTEALPRVLDLLAKALEILDIALIAIKPIWEWFWNHVLKPLGEAVGEAFLDFLDWAVLKLEEFGKWIQNNEEDFRTLVIIILVLMAAFYLLLNPIALVVAALIGLILILNTSFGKALYENMVLTWKRIFNNTEESLKRIRFNIEQFLIGIGELLIGVFTGNWEMAWDGIKRIVRSSLDNLITIVKATLDNISFFFQGWRNALQIIIGPLALWIQAAFINIIGPIQNAFVGFLNWIHNNFSSAFNGIGGIVRGIFNGLIDLVNKLISRIASAINNMANMINQFSWIMGFQIPTVQAVQIPHLATGAVVPAHANMLAMIGEGNQREVVAPEPMLRQLMSEEIAKAISNQSITINFTGNGAGIARLLKPELDRENSRVGKTMVTGGTAKG